MRIEIVPVFEDNYAYIVICPQTNQAAAVDPAQADPVLRRVEQLGVDLCAIWTTHHHWDHVSGHEAIVARYPSLEVLGSPNSGRIPCLTRSIGDGEQIALGSLRFRAVATPGHTLDAICYINDRVAFTGDTLFCSGCGRLFEGSAELMYQSLNDKLAVLMREDTAIYPGHEYTEKNVAFARSLTPADAELTAYGERIAALRKAEKPSVPSDWSTERRFNPFLRCQSRALAEAVGGDVGDPVAVFAEVRRRRDAY
ncbi:MAG: hydroxyacylglutathione hydrolase [Deltaproteobacteria bacterium]|nr:hydroxyacylglutathione hydrolase [Deltaproteobacteria bacterium]